jgi:hypothetical protein
VGGNTGSTLQLRKQEVEFGGGIIEVIEYVCFFSNIPAFMPLLAKFSDPLPRFNRRPEMARPPGCGIFTIFCAPAGSARYHELLPLKMGGEDP